MSLILYPNAHPETVSVDGNAWHNTGGNGTGVTWATLIAAAGNGALDTDTEDLIFIHADGVLIDKWRQIWRGFALFYITGLPGLAIATAKLRLWGIVKDWIGISSFAKYEEWESW